MRGVIFSRAHINEAENTCFITGTDEKPTQCLSGLHRWLRAEMLFITGNWVERRAYCESV